MARQTRVTVALDSIFAARQLSDAARAAQVEFGVLAEMDVGLGRVGVSPGEPLLELAQCDRPAAAPGVRRHRVLSGPHQGPGRSRACARWRSWANCCDSVLADFRRAGIEVRIVSGGSTPTLFHSHEVARPDGDPAGHLRFQRPQHRPQRRLRARRIAPPAFWRPWFRPRGPAR